MPAHDPLTPSQIALLDGIERNPIEMTISEEQASPHGKDLQYLLRLGLLNTQLEYIAQDVGQNRYRYTRSDKKLDQ